jgi:ribosomal protein S18 acetylase RimI-like enzyme
MGNFSTYEFIMNDMEFNITFRHDVRPADTTAVRELVEATRFFSAEETEIAVELVEECLAKGEAGGYFFIFGEMQGRIVCYACYGPVPATRSSYDIYWMAVHPVFQRRGLGRKLLEMCETLIREAGGRQIYMDTSARVQYEPTRRLYETAGYRQAAYLTDFYAPGDAKVIYEKILHERNRETQMKPIKPKYWNMDEQ